MLLLPGLTCIAFARFRVWGLGFHACGRTASDLEFKMVGGVGFYGLGSIGPLHQGTLRNFRVLGSGFTV